MKLDYMLKQLIVNRGIKVAQLARATRVPAQTLFNWLSGQSPKNVEQVKAVADYFGVSVDYLCFGEQGSATDLLMQKTSELNVGVWEVVLRKVKER